MNPFFSFLGKIVVCLTTLLSVALPLEGEYIQRFSTVDNGGILFTGNSLGLSKELQLNEPGSQDSIGAFITTDTNSKVNRYEPGTTLNWRENRSTAVLDLPEGSKVLYAELIWSGSYGFGDEIIGDVAKEPIIFIDPSGGSHTIKPETFNRAVTPGYKNKGNYVASANVTNIVDKVGRGTYTAGGVPATVAASDDTHNAAGWTLGVVYHNGAELTYNLTLFVGCEQASYSFQPVEVSGICVPSSGVLNGKLFVSAIEGDPNKVGDQMFFGSSPNLNSSNLLQGPNNPINNFFCSQINTLGVGQLDGRGSFGDHNAVPGKKIDDGSRVGYDITCVDISNQLVYNQNTAYALGTTTGDDYTINALALQIQTGAPIIQSTKQVNGLQSVDAIVNDQVTFGFTLENNGTLDASDVVFRDLLESGLEYVPGTFQFNGNLQADPDLNTGFSIGALPIGGSCTIIYQAKIVGYPASGNVLNNIGYIDYQYTSCTGARVALTSDTNLVSINLPKDLNPNLVLKKSVNATDFIYSSPGSYVTFTIDVVNTGKGSAINVFLYDDLPSELSLVPDSLTVNGVLITPTPDLSTGVNIGDINVGETTTISFEAFIIVQPSGGLLLHNQASTTYQGIPEQDVILNFSGSSNQVTVSLSPTPPPKHFIGILKPCRYLNRTDYCLKITWDPPEAPGVQYYLLYRGNKLVKKVLPRESLAYEVCGVSPESTGDYYITAVYQMNQTSNFKKIRIINE